jgi:hypothetical protein
MKKLLLMMIFVGIASVPAVFADQVNLFAGYVLPSGNSDVFDQNARETTFRTSDLDGWGGTIGYDHFLGEFFNLGLSTSYYHDDTTVQDVDFTYQDGHPILRDLHFEIVPLEFNLHVLPLGRNPAVIPYLGGGFGVYFWNYEEAGDFVFNRLTNPNIVTGRAHSDGVDPGYHVEGGLMIPFSRNTTFTAEAKYWHAHGKLDVSGFDPSFGPLDLSATMFQAGVSIWF